MLKYRFVSELFPENFFPWDVFSSLIWNKYIWHKKVLLRSFNAEKLKILAENFKIPKGLFLHIEIRSFQQFFRDFSWTFFTIFWKSYEMTLLGLLKVIWGHRVRFSSDKNLMMPHEKGFPSLNLSWINYPSRELIRNSATENHNYIYQCFYFYEIHERHYDHVNSGAWCYQNKIVSKWILSKIKNHKNERMRSF